MAISDDEVLHIARLSHIKLSEDEVEGYRRDLNSILDFIDKLKDLDAPEERMTHAAAVESRLRDDRVSGLLGRDEVLENAAAVEDGQFRVPKVLEGE